MPGTFSAFSDPKVDAWITELAKDLSSAKGRSLVLCGSQQPPEVHDLVASINKSLGNSGITYQDRFVPHAEAASIGDLAAQITAGTVKTLFVLGGNPAFNAPAELNFTDLLGKVEQVIRLGLHVDETSAASTTHLPAAHFLESWGDSLAYDSSAYLCQQPLILPLYEGISEIDFPCCAGRFAEGEGAGTGARGRSARSLYLLEKAGFPIGVRIQQSPLSMRLGTNSFTMAGRWPRVSRSPAAPRA